ncbi:MAG: hypothetical protein ACLFTW_15515 [Chitinispirillaceae bacterium]
MKFNKIFLSGSSEELSQAIATAKAKQHASNKPRDHETNLFKSPFGGFGGAENLAGTVRETVAHAATS